MMRLTEINKAEAARYMGVRGVPDNSIQELLDRYEPVVREKLKGAYVWRETEVTFAAEGVLLGGVSIPLVGNSIRGHLKDCSRAVIMAATVSAEADKLIRQTSVTDMTGALAVDCLCSAAIEQVCSRAEEEIFAEIQASFRTWRFSPGYGDLPIGVQKELLLSLNAQRRIGLTVTDSCLLLPTKSVTAIIGISDEEVTGRKNGCDACTMGERCQFRKTGGCGKSAKQHN